MSALPLRHYQREFIDAFKDGKSSLCAFEQGLGKTLTAIALALELQAKKVLVICPASVVSVWAAEIKKWDPTAWITRPRNARGVQNVKALGTHFTVVNPDKLVRNVELLDAIVDQGDYDLLCLDESHMFKTVSAKRTRVVFQRLAPVCKRILPMSGTPCPSHVGELYTMLRYLGRHLISKPNGEVMTLREYEDRWCNVEMKWIGGRQLRVIKGSRNVHELKARIGDFMFRRTKAQCLMELPPMQFETLPLELSGLDAKHLPAVDVNLDDDELLRFLNGDEHIATAMRQIGVAKAAAFAEYAKDWMSNCESKMVIWCKHHDALDLLVDALQPFNPAKIDGRDSQKKRDDAVAKFLTDPTCRVFIGQIRACGTGLTLLTPTCQPSDVYFVEQEWVPGDNAQAAARVHRIGQNSAVLVRTVVAEGVHLDQRLGDVLTRKIREIGELL
jgi:SWI/SNF-related matrix-associated actin-dependent regulator 1 of chromatin subfamily A